MSSLPQESAHDENARYKRVIRSAEELFKKVGFRAVTMELVAREANVAKATLYSYFKNKDELYVAVCARMAQILRDSVETALFKPEAPIDDRLAEAIVAKHRPVFTFVRGSPHAAELFSYTHSVAHEIFAKLDLELLQILAAEISKDAELAPSAERLARALYFGSGSLASRTETTVQMEREVGDFARTQVAGVRALARERPLPLNPG